MKLGNQTASLTNHLYSRMTVGQPQPAIGMGATVLMWTDRRAGTVVDIQAAHGTTVITVQDDTAGRTDSNGMSECQEYSYEPNPNGARTSFILAADGAWKEVRRNPATGRWNRVEGGGNGLRLGERRHYRDYSF